MSQYKKYKCQILKKNVTKMSSNLMVKISLLQRCFFQDDFPTKRHFFAMIPLCVWIGSVFHLRVPACFYRRVSVVASLVTKATTAGVSVTTVTMVTDVVIDVVVDVMRNVISSQVLVRAAVRPAG